MSIFEKLKTKGKWKKNGKQSSIQSAIPLKSREEIAFIKEVAEIAVESHSEIRALIEPGITTEDLNLAVRDIVTSRGAISASFGYRGFPSYAQFDLNDRVINSPADSGITLKEGDILGVGIQVSKKGYFASKLFTYPVGIISTEVEYLLRVTEGALSQALCSVRSGNHIGDISYAIQQYVEGNSYSVVKEFVGHGIGRKLHEMPEIPCYGVPGRGPVLTPGMVLCVITLVNAGDHKVRILPDGWAAVTLDGSLSAYASHMVCVTESELIALD